MATRSKVLDLYRCLLRESSKFPTYNYRMYALRRIKHAFRRNKDINDAEKIIELYNYGAKNLEIIKRQDMSASDEQRNTWTLPCHFQTLSLMNCKSRAEAFAKSLHNKLKSLGRLTGDGQDDEEDDGDNPFSSKQPISTTSVCRPTQNEKTRLMSAQHHGSPADNYLSSQHGEDELYFDFDISSPESPADQDEVLVNRNHRGNLPRNGALVTRQPGKGSRCDEFDPCYSNLEFTNSNFAGLDYCCANANGDGESGCISAVSSVITEQDNDEEDYELGDFEEAGFIYPWSPPSQPLPTSPTSPLGQSEFLSLGLVPVCKLDTIEEQATLEEFEFAEQQQWERVNGESDEEGRLDPRDDLDQGHCVSANAYNSSLEAGLEDLRFEKSVLMLESSRNVGCNGVSVPREPSGVSDCCVMLTDECEGRPFCDHETSMGGVDVGPLEETDGQGEDPNREISSASDHGETRDSTSAEATCEDSDTACEISLEECDSDREVRLEGADVRPEESDVIGRDTDTGIIRGEATGALDHGDSDTACEISPEGSDKGAKEEGSDEGAKEDGNGDSTDRESEVKEIGGDEANGALTSEIVDPARESEVTDVRCQVCVVSPSPSLSLCELPTSPSEGGRLTVDVSLVAVGGDEALLSPTPEDDFPQRVRRSSSLKSGKTPPGTPNRKKIVRFADAMGLDLEAVKTVFLDDLPNVPSSAFVDLQDADDSATKTSMGMGTYEGRSGVFPPFGITKPTRNLVPVFPQPASLTDFVDRVRRQGVCLESAVMAGESNVRLVIRVLNLDFNKYVSVRYTFDGWAEVHCSVAEYVPDSHDGFSDKFATVVNADRLQPGDRLALAIQYVTQGKEFWDNNYGQNYCFQCFVDQQYQPSPTDDSWVHFL